MATTFQNRTRLTKNQNVQKPRTKKPVTRPSPSKQINNPKDIEIRFGNNSLQKPMYKPASILKKQPRQQPYADAFNENVVDWRPPSDLRSIPPRAYYSPIHTPPRLRTLITPPGVIPYRNLPNLRRFSSPLPPIDGHYSSAIDLTTWGINPLEYNLGSNINLFRRHPSPLSNYGLGSGLQKPKKPYIVVPNLHNLLTSPVSNFGDDFTLPSRRRAPVYNSKSPNDYLDIDDQFYSPRFTREPTDYMYVRGNEAFANQFIDDFIGKTIENQLIPDMLLEVIGELERENKNRGGRSYKTNVDRYFAELNRRINNGQENNTHLFSDEWVRDLDYQRPYASSFEPDSNRSSIKPIDNEYVPVAHRTNIKPNKNLPIDNRKHLITDVDNGLVGFDDNNTEKYFNTQSDHDQPYTNSNAKDNNRKPPLHPPYASTDDNGKHSRVNNNHNQQAQFDSIENYAKDKLLDSICLDQLIGAYTKYNGSVVDVDELSRLLDSIMMENLISQYQSIQDGRSRTVDNYGAKKFHLNTFMNITMDLLLTELSASLIEDMKDLDEHEQNKPR